MTRSGGKGDRGDRQGVTDASTSPDAPRFGRPDATIAALVGAGALALFVATLCPTIYIEDSPEFSTAAAVFGLPHPPGYPLHTLLSALFVRAIPFGDVGYRSNLFSAVCGASAVALLWVFLRRIDLGRVASLTATFCFALGSTFWAQCLAAEVHALNCLLLILALLLTFEATRSPTRRGFALSGLAIGLLIGHRNLNVIFMAPLLILLEAARRKSSDRARLLGTFIGGVAVTGLLYLYLPLAAWRDPPLDMGAPSTLRRFYTVVSAQPYFRHFATAPAAVNLNRLLGFFRNLPANLGMGALAAPVGFVAWRRRSGFLAPLTLTWIVLSCVGFSALYNVLDVDSYFLPATLALAVLSGFGFDAWRGRLRIVLPVVALAALPLHLEAVSLHRFDTALTYGRDLFRSAPPRATVISFGDTTTHVLWYEQAVEHLRADVAVVSFDEIDGWYVDQLSRRHPDIDWPAAEAKPQWLGDFVDRNRTQRPICLTQPLDLGIPGWKAGPSGLLFCLQPGIDRAELSRSIDFWRDTSIPSPADLEGADVHLQMIAFSYATARFALAGALVGAGDLDGAQTQLRAIVASDPDRAERAIVASMKTIGREGHSAFDLGSRAGKALSTNPRDGVALLALLRL